ncbi:CoA transferase subunit A [Amycolatopsis sp. cmx-4-68]|uniref:CoA transferase subunit A n=1 Tax=Amycolatopsis sp. cmx-4-68 TaxID=2790938 RepID=UPI00397C55CE
MKGRASAIEALENILADGQTVAVGGFGLCGVPVDLVDAVRQLGVRDLTIVSNNMGVDGKGLGLLLETRQVRKVIASYVGENQLFAEQHMTGLVEVEFTPQGTLAERMRAGGAGIPAFYTATGVGTPVAEGKPHADFDGRSFVLERAIVADVALVRAHLADTEGNLAYRLSARNLNPLVAACARVTVAEAEVLLDEGFVDPERVVTPGIFVQRVVRALPRQKDVEQRTVRPRPATTGAGGL